MNEQKYFQHGDVLLKQIEKPKNIEKLDTDIFHQGQNHAHKVRGKFCIGKSGDKIFLHSRGCEIYHDEHAALQIPEGVYEKSIVNEYDHFLEESRQVID